MQRMCLRQDSGSQLGPSMWRGWKMGCALSDGKDLVCFYRRCRVLALYDLKSSWCACINMLYAWYTGYPASVRSWTGWVSWGEFRSMSWNREAKRVGKERTDMNKSTGRGESLTYDENCRSTNTEAACALKPLVITVWKSGKSTGLESREPESSTGSVNTPVGHSAKQEACPVLGICRITRTWHASPHWIRTTTLSDRYYRSFFRGGKSEIKKQVQDYTVNREHSCN